MVIMGNLQFYLLKRLKQKQTYIFCFEIFICLIVYLSKNFCLYRIFKLLIRTRIDFAMGAISHGHTTEPNYNKLFVKWRFSL